MFPFPPLPPLPPFPGLQSLFMHLARFWPH